MISRENSIVSVANYSMKNEREKEIEEYKDSCQNLSKQYPNGVPKFELKHLQSTYVLTEKISKHKAKEIERYYLSKPSILTTLKRQLDVFLNFKENQYLWIVVVIIVVIIFVALLQEEWQKWQEGLPDKTLSKMGEFDFIICARSPSEKDWKRLFLVKSSGEKELFLKNIKNYQLHPSISRDKKWLVFQRGLAKSAKICIVNLKTRAITNNCMHTGKMPSISPDGKKIVYVPIEDSNSMEIMNLNDFKQKRIPISLSHNEIAKIKRPTFLNDSENIVFLGREVTSNYMEVVLYEPDRPSDKQFKLLTNYAQHIEFLTPATNSRSLLFELSHTHKESILLLQPDFRNGEIVEIPCGFKAKFPVFSMNEKQIYFISDNRVKYIERSDKTCSAKDYTGKLDLINMIDLIPIQ